MAVSDQSFIHQMLRSTPPQQAEAPLTPERALKVALGRAAERVLQRRARVRAVQVAETEVDILSADPQIVELLIEIVDGDEVVGLIGCDHGLVGMIVEWIVAGQVSDRQPKARPITRTDMAFVIPFLSAALDEIRDVGIGTAMEGWIVDEMSLGQRVTDAAKLPLVLPDRPYGMVQLDFDLGVDSRSAKMIVLLPQHEEPVVEDEDPEPPEWTLNLHRNVMESQADLNAVLCRLPMSMQDIHGFEVGQVIALAGADIGGVRAEGPARQLLGQARLGQLNGMRAIRIEAPKAAELQDVEMADPEGSGVSLIGQGVDTRG